MSDLNVTKGDWLVTRGYGLQGYMVRCVNQYNVVGEFDNEHNAHLFAQAKNMYEKLTYLNKLLLSLGPEVWHITDLGAESNSIEQLLNACKPPEE